MKTIEERADAYVGHPEEIDEFTSETIKRKAYIAGAKEQKYIDIEKAKTAFVKSCGWLSTFPWYNAVFEEFTKNIDE